MRLSRCGFLHQATTLTRTESHLISVMWQTVFVSGVKTKVITRNVFHNVAFYPSIIRLKSIACSCMYIAFNILPCNFHSLKSLNPWHVTSLIFRMLVCLLCAFVCVGGRRTTTQSGRQSVSRFEGRLGVGSAQVGRINGHRSGVYHRPHSRLPSGAAARVASSQSECTHTSLFWFALCQRCCNGNCTVQLQWQQQQQMHLSNCVSVCCFIGITRFYAHARVGWCAHVTFGGAVLVWDS